MAHARRKFRDSLPKDKARESDANSVARQGIHYCDQMFSLERSWKDLSAESWTFWKMVDLNCPTTEQAVKEIVMGRKNWLFSQSSTGAKAMAIIMSILETAKQNGLDQFKYINYLLDKLPNEPSLLDNQRLEAYLLWSENVQPHCK